jgi:hypothetical protein
MLIHLSLENFKIWKATGPMRLAPVTLFLGTNSSGKSSLIQALLLIRQTVKGGDDNQDLNLGNPDAGDSVALGQYKDMLCRFGSSNRVGIEFRWSASGEPASSTIFSARYRRGARPVVLNWTIYVLVRTTRVLLSSAACPKFIGCFWGANEKAVGKVSIFTPAGLLPSLPPS